MSHHCLISEFWTIGGANGKAVLRGARALAEEDTAGKPPRPASSAEWKQLARLAVAADGSDDAALAARAAIGLTH